MNFSKPFPPKSEPHLSKSQRDLAELEQRINEILFHSMQLQRTLWQVVTEHGGTVTIDEAALNPLWNLTYERMDGHKFLLKIAAGLLPEPTTEQLERLAAKLAGTKNPPDKAMDELGLGEYPRSYIVKSLLPFVVCTKDGTWLWRGVYDELSSEKPEPPQGSQPPKSDAV